MSFMSFWPMPHTEASSASISMPYSPDCSREIPEMISSASGSTEMSSLHCGQPQRCRIPCQAANGHHPPFCRDNLFTDSQVHYSYANEICGMLNSWCDSTRWETGMKPLKSTMRKSRMSEHQKQEALYEKRFREGGCTLGDMNHKRHRNTYYINSFPCGTKCPHCGTFWID